MKKARVFKAEFKAAAVKRMQQGENTSALARELKIRESCCMSGGTPFWRDGH
jgi:transposase-like protein